MTDEDADALLRPARRWPPLAAVAAAGLIVLPPVALAGMALAYRRWVDLLVPIVCLAVVVRPGVNLLRGNRAGVGGGLGCWRWWP